MNVNVNQNYQSFNQVPQVQANINMNPPGISSTYNSKGSATVQTNINTNMNPNLGGSFSMNVNNGGMQANINTN